MTSVLVVDSSALVALLADGGDAGTWVASAVEGADPAAPELVCFEVANVLRRQELRGHLTAAEASLAHQDLLDLPLQLWPYLPLAPRTWQLRRSVSAYDAAYVALAEMLEAPLVTLDLRLARACGPMCQVLTPAGEPMA